jgi:Tol biopolymer transport system component/predicted Ser/Thr protein kinase
MALSAGTRLGPYEILAPVGAGGMGEVYRARDTRLGREVALKVLPAHLSASPELRRRLEREAKAVSQLSHPHICTLHDSGREGEADFLVMEYLEGETLAHRLEKGPLPLEQALQTASEIAAALDKAHRQGVVHRDLKPGNIMLTKGGAKLLDFGLAKLHDPASVEGVDSMLPTQAQPLTEEGKIVGTYPYMAPEQLEGEKADGRTDIFAFGAVLYEMVAGQRAFEGRRRASLIAAILSSEPRPITELQPMTPPLLDRVVRRCLAKEPDERWQSAADLANELKWIGEGHSEVGTSTAAPGRAGRLGTRWRRVGSALAIAALAVVLAFWGGRRSRRSPSHPVTRFALELPASQQLYTRIDAPTLVLSRDGQKLIFVGGQGQERQIYVRSMDDLEIRPISGTRGLYESSLFVSPDGRWIGYYKDRRLWKVLIEDGVPVPLLDSAANIWQADWGEDDTITFAAGSISGLFRIPANGGEPEVLTKLDSERGEVFHGNPQMLPGGRALLFSVSIGNYDAARIEVLSLGTGSRHVVIKDVFCPAYVPSGHIVFGRDGTIMAAPFDIATLEVTGTAVPVLSNVQMDTWNRVASFAVSPTGTLVYVPSGQGIGEGQLVWTDREGATQPLRAPPGLYLTPKLSPDGTQLAVGQRRGSGVQLMLYDLQREVPTQLTFEGAYNFVPVWSPDGKRIAFWSARGGQFNIFLTAADGTGTPQRLQASTLIQRPGSWSPDGEYLAYVEATVEEQHDIWTLRISEPGEEPEPFLTSEFNEISPAFSPDGRWIAYASDESGRFEIYVKQFLPGSGGDASRKRVSREGGWQPVWSREGEELFYRDIDGTRLMAVNVRTEPRLEVGEPRVLLAEPDTPPPTPFESACYDVAADGRFLMISESESRRASMKVVVVLNWSEELKKQMAEAGQATDRGSP